VEVIRGLSRVLQLKEKQADLRSSTKERKEGRKKGKEKWGGGPSNVCTCK
jgi:hypothetical protein